MRDSTYSPTLGFKGNAHRLLDSRYCCHVEVGKLTTPRVTYSTPNQHRLTTSKTLHYGNTLAHGAELLREARSLGWQSSTSEHGWSGSGGSNIVRRSILTLGT